MMRSISAMRSSTDVFEKVFEGALGRGHGAVDIVRAAARGHRGQGSSVVGSISVRVPGRNGSAHPPSMKS